MNCSETDQALGPPLPTSSNWNLIRRADGRLGMACSFGRHETFQLGSCSVPPHKLDIRGPYIWAVLALSGRIFWGAAACEFV